ncbi:hypothetical protein GCM10008931_31520 [Oceanobacillus oncorhynchi subsp. oncorhynchi]|uniref:hypothetical protein n=1 Tax=Oceanobacillus oncorhynchi TaxID=545501 RepID=UPI0031DB9C6F
MKRYVLIALLFILLIGFSIFQYIEKSNLENALDKNEQKLDDMIAESDTVYFEARETAEKFILNYFSYEQHPKQDDVEEYLSPVIINELNFSSPEEYEEEMSDITSSVSDLNIYFGDAVDGRQKVLGVFDNVINVYGGDSTVQSLIEMDLENTENGWQIVDFNFFQY